MKKENNKKVNISILISLLFILLVCSIFYITKTINFYSNKAYPGQYLHDISIGEYNENEINELIDEILSHQKSKNITIKINNESYEKNLNDFNLEIKNKEYLINEIMNYGKSKNIIERLYFIIRGLILSEESSKNIRYNIQFNYDEELLDSYINEIEKLVNKDKSEPVVDISNDGDINIINGEDGYKLSVDKLKKSIIESIHNVIEQNQIIKGEGKIIEYNIDEESLKQIDTKLSSYTTTYSTGTGRATNVEIGISRVDNTLLMPNESFSLNKTVLPRTRENGYKGAPEYRNGKVIQGIGGGICQVSTTVYGAMLRTGLLATERFQHSMTVGYAPLGLDAAISGDTADLKFTNTYEYPIVVNSYTEGGKVTVEFWGNSDTKKGITYQPKSYAISSLSADAYLYGYDSDGNEVYKQYLGRSTYKPKSED